MQAMSLKRSIPLETQNGNTNSKKTCMEFDARLRKYDECLFGPLFLNEASSITESPIQKFYDLVQECVTKQLDSQLVGIMLYWCRDLLIYCSSNEYHQALLVFHQLMDLFCPLQTLNGIKECIQNGFCMELIYLCSICCIEIDSKGFVVMEEEEIEKFSRSFTDKQTLIFLKNCIISDSKKNFIETVTSRLNNLEMLKNEFSPEQFAVVLHTLCRTQSMTSFLSHRSLKSPELHSILRGKYLLSICSTYTTRIEQILAMLTNYLNINQSTSLTLENTTTHDTDSSCILYSVNSSCLEQLISALKDFPFRRAKDRNAAIDSILKLNTDIQQRLIISDEEILRRCIKINSALPADCVSARGLIHFAFNTKSKHNYRKVQNSLEPKIVAYQSMFQSKKRRSSTVECEESSLLAQRKAKSIEHVAATVNDMITVEGQPTKYSPPSEIPSELPSKISNSDGNNTITFVPITNSSHNDDNNLSMVSSGNGRIDQHSSTVDSTPSATTMTNNPVNAAFINHYDRDIIDKYPHNKLLVLFSLMNLPVPIVVPVKLLSFIPFHAVNVKYLQDIQAILMKSCMKDSLIKALTCIFLTRCKSKISLEFPYILQFFDVSEAEVTYAYSILKKNVEESTPLNAPTPFSAKSDSKFVDLTADIPVNHSDPPALASSDVSMLSSLSSFQRPLQLSSLPSSLPPAAPQIKSSVLDILIPSVPPPGNHLNFDEMMNYFEQHLSPEQMKLCQVAAASYLEKKKCDDNCTKEDLEQQHANVGRIVKTFLIRKVYQLISSGLYPMPMGGVPAWAQTKVGQLRGEMNDTNQNNVSYPVTGDYSSSLASRSFVPPTPNQQINPFVSYSMPTTIDLPKYWNNTIYSGINYNRSSASTGATPFPQTNYFSNSNNNFQMTGLHHPQADISHSYTPAANGPFTLSTPMASTTSQQSLQLKPISQLYQLLQQQSPTQLPLQVVHEMIQQRNQQQHRPPQPQLPLPILPPQQQLQPKRGHQQQPQPHQQLKHQTTKPIRAPQVSDVPFQLFQETVFGITGNQFPVSTILTNSEPHVEANTTTTGIGTETGTISTMLPTIAAVMPEASSGFNTSTNTASRSQFVSTAATTSTNVNTDVALDTNLLSQTQQSGVNAIIIHIEDIVTKSRDRVKVKPTKKIASFLNAIKTRLKSSQPLEFLFKEKILSEEETLASAGVVEGDILFFREKLATTC